MIFFCWIFFISVATTGALAAGCVLGWSSPAEYEVVTKQGYGFPVSNEQWSWIGANATLGGIVSCLIIGIIMDIFGRKTTMLSLIVPFSIGWSLIIWPTSVAMLYIGRFLIGFAGGAFFVVAPAYIGEIASKSIRGTLASYLQLMVTCGILFVYVIGHFFAMKTYNIICAILPLVFGALFIWMPETPNYWIIKNQVTKAENSLKWLRGNQYDYSDELIEMQMEHELIRQNRAGFFTAFKKPATKRALLISLGLLFFVQFSGINAVIFYSGFIFEASHADIESSVATIIVGVMQVIATFVASLTVDKLGRRFLLITSASIMCICNVCLGTYFYLMDHESPYIPHLSWLPITSLCLYIIAFSLGLGPIPWVLVGEIFTTEVKAIASSLSGSTSWLIAFLVTKFFSNIRDAIGIGETFFIFAGFALGCTIFICFMVPETKGRSFNDIQRSLGADNENSNSEADDNTTITTVSQNTIAI